MIFQPVKVTKKGERVAVPLSKGIASLYLNGLEGSWGLKHFRGITTTPILGNDGGRGGLLIAASPARRRANLWAGTWVGSPTVAKNIDTSSILG